MGEKPCIGDLLRVSVGNGPLGGIAVLTLDSDMAAHSSLHGRLGRVTGLADTGFVADMEGIAGSHSCPGPGTDTLLSCWVRLLCPFQFRVYDPMQAQATLCARCGCLRARIYRQRPLCLVDVASWARVTWRGGVGVVHVGSGSLAMLCRGWRVEMFFGRDQVNACGAESAISLAGVGGYGFFRDLLQD
jgi:hypothetical protein